VHGSKVRAGPAATWALIRLHEMSEQQEGCGAQQTVGIFFVVLGMGLAVLASVGSTFGLVLQKLAQIRNDALPDDQKYASWGGIIWSPTWVCGLLLMVLVPFPLDMIAFSLAPQSLVVPLTGFTLVLNQVVAPCVLKERVTCQDWVGTGVICSGIVLTTAFGSHCSYVYSVDQMMDLFDKRPFQIAELAFIISTLVCWICAYCGERGFIQSSPVSRSILYAYMAGAVGAQQQIFLKATGEVFESSINGDDQWGSKWECYLFIALCVVFAIGQIYMLNKGLALWSAIKYLPLYNVILIVLSTAYGSLFYEEYKDLDIYGIICFPIGVLIVAVGAAILGCKDEPGREAQSSTVVPLSKEVGHKCSDGNTDPDKPRSEEVREVEPCSVLPICSHGHELDDCQQCAEKRSKGQQNGFIAASD